MKRTILRISQLPDTECSLTLVTVTNVMKNVQWPTGRQKLQLKECKNSSEDMKEVVGSHKSIVKETA